MVRLLVEHGADLEASFDGTGRTPYAVAVRSGRPDLAELLADLGARRRAVPLDALIGACLTGTVRPPGAWRPSTPTPRSCCAPPRRTCWGDGRQTAIARPWRSCST